MSGRLLITIGITAFDAEDTVARAVGSALAQDWHPLEVVVVDDGSRDRTGAILDEWAARAPEVRVTHLGSNVGTGAARNEILDRARGVAVAFFDDDDVSEPDRITRQWARLVDYEQRFGGGRPVLCHSSRIARYPDGSEVLLPTLGTDPDLPGPHGRELVRHLLTGSPLPGGGGEAATCAQLGRLTTYRGLGGFDVRFRRQQDTELNLRLARAGGHLAGIPEPLVTQTITPTSDKALELEREMARLLISVHGSALASPAELAASRRWVEAKYAWLEGDRGAAARHLAIGLSVAPLHTTGRLIRAARTESSLRHRP